MSYAKLKYKGHINIKRVALSKHDTTEAFPQQEFPCLDGELAPQYRANTLQYTSIAQMPIACNVLSRKVHFISELKLLAVILEPKILVEL